MTRIVEQPRFLALIGGGEHARVVAEAASLAGWTVAGVIDERPVEGFAHLLGRDTDIPRLRDEMPDLQFIMAFGNLARRRALALTLGDIPWAVVVHPSAVVSTAARLEGGVFVGAQAVVQTGAFIGPHAIINTAAVVEHDVVVGTCCHCGPGSVIGGGARIGDEAHIGLNASIRDHITIGDQATVGMGAAVVDAVMAGLTVCGVPARPRGKDAP